MYIFWRRHADFGLHSVDYIVMYSHDHIVMAIWLWLNVDAFGIGAASTCGFWPMQYWLFSHCHIVMAI